MMFNGLSIPYIGKTNLSVKESAAKTLKASLNQLTKKQLEFICESYSKVDTELQVPEDENDEHEVFIYLFNSGIVKLLMHHGYIFHQFADCMISLYGVLTVRDFGRLWKLKYPELELSENQIIEHMSFSSATTRDYKWHDKLNVIAYKYFKETDVKGLMEDRSRYPFYIPASAKLNEFLNDYMNSEDEYQLNYFEMYEVEHSNPNYVHMRKFLEKYRKDDWDEIFYYCG